MRARNSVRYQKFDYNSRGSSDSSDESNSTNYRSRAVSSRKRMSIPETFVNRYFPDTGTLQYDCPAYRNLWR